MCVLCRNVACCASLQYVVETRFVGERELGTGHTEIVDVKERVGEVAQPGPTCPANTGRYISNTVSCRRWPVTLVISVLPAPAAWCGNTAAWRARDVGCGLLCLIHSELLACFTKASLKQSSSASFSTAQCIRAKLKADRECQCWIRCR